MLKFSRLFGHKVRKFIKPKDVPGMPRRCMAIKRDSNIDKHNYMNKKEDRRKVDAFGASLLIVPVGCIALGIWQIKRKAWKESVVANLTLRTQLSTIDLPDDLTNRRLLEYRRVRVKGTFDHTKEMYIGPKSCIVDGKFPDQGEMGYLVITPFQLSDRNLRILVNRGWVPDNKIDPESRPESLLEGELQLEGIIRLRDEIPSFAHDFDRRRKIFVYRDLGNMAEIGETSYLYIDLTKDYSLEGGPIAGQTIVKIRNEHLQYIITWFSMAILTGHVWYKRFLRKY